MSTAAKVQQDPEVQVKKLIDEVYGPDHVDDLHDEIEARKKSLFDAFGDEATEGSRAEAEAQIRFQAATLQSSPPSKPSAAGLSLNETATKPANETLKRPATKSAPNPATANPASKLAVKPAPKPVANIIQLPTLNPAQLEAAQLEFWGVRTPEQLKQRVRELGGAEPLIEGLLPSKSIGLIAGDSGLGKSPLLYQMGLSVAAGIPFLGRKTHQGRVLYMDFENGLKEQEDLMNRLALHLGIDLPELSKSGLFVSWNANDAHPLFGGANHTTLDIIKKAKAELVIIDSLGEAFPSAEEKNSEANKLYMRFRKEVIRAMGTTIVLVHHLKKPSDKPNETPESLENGNLRNWFLQPRGPRALINGSDIRLGVDAAQRNKEAALVLRGFARIRGEVGPLYVARKLDEEGEPLGYLGMTGVDLLFNKEQEDSFKHLPAAFAFKDAKQIYKKGDQATSDFLKKCVSLGILRRLEKGRYEKVERVK